MEIECSEDFVTIRFNTRMHCEQSRLNIQMSSRVERLLIASNLSFSFE